MSRDSFAAVYAVGAFFTSCEVLGIDVQPDGFRATALDSECNVVSEQAMPASALPGFFEGLGQTVTVFEKFEHAAESRRLYEMLLGYGDAMVCEKREREQSADLFAHARKLATLLRDDRLAYADDPFDVVKDDRKFRHGIALFVVPLALVPLSVMVWGIWIATDRLWGTLSALVLLALSGVLIWHLLRRSPPATIQVVAPSRNENPK